MRIGIDIDDVLADTLPAFVDFNARIDGVRRSLADFHTARWEDVLGIDSDALADKLERFFASPEFEAVGPADGSREVLAALAPHHDLHIVTARWECIALHTRSWLDEHFPDHFKGVHFALNHYTLRASAGSVRSSKDEIVRREDLGVLIEDSLEYAERCVERGFEVILFDRPWNQTASERRFRRVAGWSEVPAALAPLIESEKRGTHRR